MAAAMGFAVSAHATPVNLLTNGGFETGDFTGWTASIQPGSNGSVAVVNNGGAAPFFGTLPLNAAGGSYVAATGQNGPGSYSLTQSFTVAPGTSDVTVSFDLFVNAFAGFASTDPNRDFNVSPNENAQVDILTGSANPFTTAAGDIIATLYGPSTSGANPWTTFNQDLGALAAGTYQIRFAETDNQSNFNLAVDNVSVLATVPEPLSISVLGMGLAALGLVRRRKSA